VSIRDVGLAQRCPVTGLHKLTPDEIAARLPVALTRRTTPTA
jgi:hypothetical protein